MTLTDCFVCKERYPSGGLTPVVVSRRGDVIWVCWICDALNKREW